MILRHWSFDPFLPLSLLIAVWHEAGVRRLAVRAPRKAADRRRASLLFYAGLVVLDLTIASPVDYWSDRYFSLHMVGHLLLMFGVPVLIVAGAPWLPLAFGLPVRWRRALGRSLLLARWSAPFRFLGRLVRRPWVSIVGFNAVMLLWHLPGPYDLANRDSAVHVWLMHSSLLLFGTLFWLQFIGSYPLHPTLRPLQRAGALFGTNAAMFVLAMAIGMMSTRPWYAVYGHGVGARLSALGDQQVGAGILWVCGDFWCFPALYRAVKEWISEDERRNGRLLVESGTPGLA